MDASILLIEDHRDLAQTVIQALESEGYVLDYADNGIHGLELATTQVFDAIILDLMLPGLDGLELCAKLRNDYGIDTPVLMLTARDELDDKLTGFAHGADDYLVKPFQMAELQARLQALIKRRRGEMSVRIWKIADLSLDTSTMTVQRADTQIPLSPIAFNILRILMRESPKVVSREALEHELWGDEPPDSDALRSHIYTLRKAIDRPFAKDLLKTVKGVGIKIADA